MNQQFPSVMVETVPTPENPLEMSWGNLFPVLGALFLLILLLQAGSARAQFPRIGISASPEAYVDSLDVVMNEEFTLYVCVFGVDDETPLEQDFTSLSWVLHQVCCGAVLYVEDVQYSPEFQHEGSPVFGVVSSSATCVDQPSILLATMTMTIEAETNGAYLAACGPYQHAVDCEGQNPLMMGLPMTLNMTGGSTPTEALGWGSLKALYQ